MGSWWQVDVGKLAAPVFGKNFLSDQLMLVFTDTDRFLHHAKRDDLAEFDRLSADDPKFAMGARPRSWHTRLLGYSTTAGPCAHASNSRASPPKGCAQS